MKHLLKKLTAAGLALSLMLGQAALASDALGHDLHAGTTILSEGTTLTRGYFWSDTYNDLRTERYFTYTPNESVHPTVVYGDALLNRYTLSHMAKSLEDAGKRVVGGVNGDFYVPATGEPLGLVVTDGIVRSSSSYHPAVGFRADGTALVGTPYLNVSAVMLDERVTVFGGINKVRQIRSEDGGGLTLLTGDFGANTQNTAPGVDVFLKPIEDEMLGETLSAEDTGLGRELLLSKELRVGSRVRCTVDYVSEAAGANPIPQGMMVLTMNGKDDEGTLNMLRSLQPGDEVCIDLTTEDRRWEEVTESVGGLFRLLENGQLGQGLEENNGGQTSPRTAIGVKENGDVIFYTMDGRQPKYSVGATCEQVALRLLELGCVDAIGLDGGGSTTLGATGTLDNSFGILNKPSDGNERRNTSAVFLTTELERTGEPSYLQIEPTDALLLSGATLPLVTYRVDTGYRVLGAASNVEYDPQGGGSVESGAFLAGDTDALTTLVATQGELTGQATITTIRTPDAIEVTNEATGGLVLNLALEPGEQVPLRAEALWRNLPLQSRDENYTWACDETVGAITADGSFTAGAKSASGEITVAAGDHTMTIPVNVAGHILLLDDMEKEDTLFTATELVGAVLETDLTHVRVGRQSLRVDYDTGAEGWSGLSANISIPAGEKYVGLWVYGNGSLDTLIAHFTGPEAEESVPLCGLNFTGWKHVLIPVPQGCDTLKQLIFLYGGGAERTGTIWLDQLTTANEEREDLTPPQIVIEVTDGTQLTATVSDDVDRTIAAGAVMIQYDGAMISGEWNAKANTFKATLPELTLGSHRVTVTAVDISGNVGRASYDIPNEAVVEFADMVDHWAQPYAGYLYEQGITYGVSDGEKVYFQPNSNITRAEFFTLVARWMGLDLTAYEDVELPFADLADIPEWAIAPVKAMYQRGVIQGSLDGGVLYLHPMAGVSRCEVMTILGRTQMKGYPEAELSEFTDSGEVPAWAESYVRSLVGQGIVNGYGDGTLKVTAPMTRGEAAKVLWALR